MIAKISIALSLAALVQATSGSQLNGVWETDNGGLKLEMYDTGGSYSGRVLYGNRLVEADGRTWKKDTLNPSASLRSRSLNRIDMVTGLKWNASEKRWEGGRFYDASSGRSYNARATLNGTTLELRGYMGTPMLGRTVKFHRVAR